ncbi:MAG: zinc-binding dehydrogenase [SAR202 cluster bacterium]|nr:zinc-binding dehydrogenase [SAR202 cluster bacterium]
MKAAVYQGKQRFQVKEIATPVPGPKQILVKVDFCGVCGTDVHAFMFDVAQPGAVLGHEFSGTVAAIGGEVSEWKVGDRVIGGGGEPPVGQEPATRVHPRYNYRTMGFQHGRTRAYAEYTLMEPWEPLRLPKGVPPEAGALCEPSAVAVHAIRLSGLRLGDSVGIIGAGPIGLLCLQAARAAGASRVFVSEPAPARAQAARKLGADLVLDPLKSDVTDGMVQATNGVGPDVVFDCAGIKSTLDQAMNTVRRGGQVTLVAVPWEPLPVLPVDWMAREVRLATSWGSRPEDWRIALNLMQTGALSTASIMSEASFVPLEKIQSVFEALMKPTTQLQVVVKP